MTTDLMINGRPYRSDLPEDVPLLWVLRDEAGLTGTKFGCGVAACGACTVHIDGEAVRACQVRLGARSPRSRGARRGLRLCNRRGSTIRCRNADTANRGKSCRPL